MATIDAAVRTQDVIADIVAGQPVGQDTYTAGEPAHMPIALGVPVAEDNFFAGEPGIIGTFDFDYEKMVLVETNKACLPILCCMCIWMPPAWICLPCYMCHVEQEVAVREKAKHVALTRDGIWYVVEGYDGKCIPNFRAKQSKFIRYDTIRDCHVQEPGKSVYCCIEDLSVVTIDTQVLSDVSAPAISGAKHQGLMLRGLKYYREFVRIVSAMKRGEMLTGTSPAGLPTTLVTEGDTPIEPTADATRGGESAPPARTLGRALDPASVDGVNDSGSAMDTDLQTSQGGSDLPPMLWMGGAFESTNESDSRADSGPDLTQRGQQSPVASVQTAPQQQMMM